MIETLTSSEIDISILQERAQSRLLNEMTTSGHWEGELCSSPLATAVAIVALALSDQRIYQSEIQKGLTWLSKTHIDGGWGDSTRDPANLSTTLLCWSAFTFAENGEFGAITKATDEWLAGQIGELNSENICKAVLHHYGNDRTFSAPILTLCALAGRLGPEPHCWSFIPQLPMELAALPHRTFQWLQLPVVSYAIPALIAIGLVRHRRFQRKWNLSNWIRKRLTPKLLHKLATIQPVNGGYLEATPLTGFVVMSLAAAGFRDHMVSLKGIGFLLRSQRRDGSWPIDTNLATWLTTLSIKGLAVGTPLPLSQSQRQTLITWILSQQNTKEHAFTHAAPGGWSWTNLAGAVPDADDTAGVILALKTLAPQSEQVRNAVQHGIQWLIDLQNRDGGIPTFCRGWGKLPFDRSCPDITAHALRAMAAWRKEMPRNFQEEIGQSMSRATTYLIKTQRSDGSWCPLWFGNAFSDTKENPVYGTVQVLMAFQSDDYIMDNVVSESAHKAREWLRIAQNLDGGWGSDYGQTSTIEETALALTALAGHGPPSSLRLGIKWLTPYIIENNYPASPMGLYFASLWYHEKLYPIIFIATAMSRLASLNNHNEAIFKGDRDE